jgi:probable HAF family extracellular repeat protein
MPVYNYTTLDDPSSVGFTTTAGGINSAGQIVGNYGNASGTHGFLYSSGAYITIDDPLATGETTADGINATGLIVGGYRSIENATHGFIYNPGTGNL